jgi:putative hydrolase of the HAD superfamily
VTTSTPNSPGNGRPASCTLFVDADDTLWENNVYFEAVVHRYCELLEARGHSAEQSRSTLLDIERVRTKTHGYGVDNFRLSLRAACRFLLGETCEEEVGCLDAACAGIRIQPMALLPGVGATLAALAARHRLVMLTKGDACDQHDKVERSGLAGWFAAVDVVKEKDPHAYELALARHGAEPGTSWMVGNSPKSDVVPALAAGLGAVFIPHPATWVLELDPLPEGPHERLLVLDRFEQLVDHF